MVNKEQMQEPSIVADPGLDPMSALRQTTQQAQAVTNGTVSNPAIEASKGALAANQAAQAALPPVKYSRDGIPEGLDHVSEMERLRAMIQGNTASANDIDNYITLQTRAANQAAQEFQRSGEAAAVDNILGGADGGGGDAKSPAAGQATGQAAAASGARVAGRAQQAGGAGGQSHSVRMGGGSPPSAPARGNSGARSSVGGAKQAVDTPAPKKPAVDMSYLSDPNDGPVDKVTMSRPGKKAEEPNPYKMASKGMSFENTEREQNIQKAYQSGDREGGRMMLEYSGAKTPGAARLAAAEEDSGAQSVNMPKIVRTGGGAAGSILMNKAAGAMSRAGTSAGQRGGAGLETAKALASKPAPAAPVNNNISRVAKPVGLIKAGLPEKPTAAGVRQTIQASEPTPSPRPKPAKSATAAATSASEYLEKRDAGALPKAPQGSLASKAPSREPMRSQGSSSPSRQSSAGAGRLNDQGGKKTGVGSINKPKRPEAPAPKKPAPKKAEPKKPAKPKK